MTRRSGANRRRPGHGQSQPLWSAAVLAPLLLLTVAACSGGSAAASPGAGSTGAVPSRPSEPRLWIKDGGSVVPLENGHTVAVDGLDVEIYVAPYPPGRQASIDFYLTRHLTPVEGGIVTVQYDMTVMEHGPFAILARATGRGHYLASMDFPMAGDFWVNAWLETGGSKSVINLFVQASR